MLCSVCNNTVKKTAHFCRRCGHAVPILVGASYPYGIRFPALMDRAHLYQAVVNRAQVAPKYRERRIGSVLYHSALYDRLSLGQLLPLIAMVEELFSGGCNAIEHSTDGRHFTHDRVPWNCFCRMFVQRELPAEDLYLSHRSMKCHSFFGCVFAQRRQQTFVHAENREVFLHGLDGRFENVNDDSINRVFENWPRKTYGNLHLKAFRLDRVSIKRRVFDLIRSMDGHHCPGFSSRYLERQIARLPEWIEPEKTPGWGFYLCPVTNRPGVYFDCYKDHEGPISLPARRRLEKLSALSLRQ